MLGAPIIRSIAHLSLYGGSPIEGNYHFTMFVPNTETFSPRAKLPLPHSYRLPVEYVNGLHDITVTSFRFLEIL